jgi:hypothetical protein
MGGWGSGRQNGRPLVDDSLKIDISEMVRRGWLRPGESSTGSLSWSTNGEYRSSVSYSYDLSDRERGWLELRYTLKRSGEPQGVVQRIDIVTTRPEFGGLRWWLKCPYRGLRVRKLYLPPGGDRFASRRAWRLGYQSQREPPSQRPFDALCRLQKKLGCRQGWEEPLRRPKGMWQRTFDRHLERFWDLDALCAVEMMGALKIINGR